MLLTLISRTAHPARLNLRSCTTEALSSRLLTTAPQRIENAGTVLVTCRGNTSKLARFLCLHQLGDQHGRLPLRTCRLFSARTDLFYGGYGHQSRHAVTCSRAKIASASEKHLADDEITDNFDKHSNWRKCIAKTVLGLSFLSLAFFITSTIQHVRAFRAQDTSASFHAYAWYHFTDWFGTSKLAQPLLLTMLVQLICVVSACTYARVQRVRLSEGLWRSWYWVISPDGGAGEIGVAARYIGAFTSISGVIVFALLVSMLSDAFASQMGEIKTNPGPIVDSQHIVMLGWTAKSLEFVREVAVSASSENGVSIAVLDPRPIDELRHAIDVDIEDVELMGSRVIARSGEAFSARDLEKVAANSARSIVILADESVPPIESDAVAMQKLMSLLQQGWPKKGCIIVHVSDHMNKSFFESLFAAGAGGPKVVPVVLDKLVATVMVQSTRFVGISEVYRQTLGFQDNEIYIMNWPSLIGKPFGEVVFQFEQAVPIGILTESQMCLLCPPAEYEIKETDRIIAYAEDDSTYRPAEACAMDYSSWLHEHPQRFSPCSPHAPKKQLTLIIGWSSLVPQLLHVLGNVCAAGSSCVVLSEIEADRRTSDLERYEKRMKVRGVLSKLQITHAVGSTIVRSDLESLPICLADYDNIFFCSESIDRKSPTSGRHARLAADGRTLASVLLVKDILAITAVNKGQCLVPQVLDAGTAQIMANIGISDYIDSNRIVSQVLAMASEDACVSSVVEATLSCEGPSFRLFPLQQYLPPDAVLPQSTSFWDVTCLVRRASNDIVIGWVVDDTQEKQSNADSHVSCVLNPQEKHVKIPWKPGNTLVVLHAGTYT